MKIDEVELRLIRLPYRTPFRTSFADQREKHAVIVTVRSEGSRPSARASSGFSNRKRVRREASGLRIRARRAKRPVRPT